VRVCALRLSVGMRLGAAADGLILAVRCITYYVDRRRVGGRRRPFVCVRARARARTGNYLLSAAAAAEIPSDFTASQRTRQNDRDRESMRDRW